MTGGPVDLAALRRRAAEVLPPDVFGYYAAGAGSGRTAATESSAWDDVRLRPRVLTGAATTTTHVTVLGEEIAAPVLVGPTALHGPAHPDAEIATARGARAAALPYVVSMRASRRLDDIAAVSGIRWQQIYVLRDRGVSDEVARRAAVSGARALVLTVDTPHAAWKAAGVPTDASGCGLIPELDRRHPDDPALQQAPDLGVDDLARLREVSGLPVVAKGVLRGDQALRCLDAGASAVVVSTHGGRQLDGVVPVPFALAEVADAVDGRAEVYADGGIRDGADVLRALALGARAVLLGRPVLWALATGGADGVEDLLTWFTGDVRAALALAGCNGPADVGRDIARLW